MAAGSIPGGGGGPPASGGGPPAPGGGAPPPAGWNALLRKAVMALLISSIRAFMELIVAVV